MTDLRALVDRPLAVGGRTLPNRLVLAPMSGLGHVAFRELLEAFGGCGLMFSEMCAAGRVPGENRHTSPCFRWRDKEAGRLVVQIVGTAPEAMARAARRIEAEGLFGVDVNFGCSAAAIRKRHGGAEVLKTPGLAIRIIREVRRAVSCPLFVKYRTGWADDPAAAVELARRFEAEGADGLTFHPRVAPDRRSRPPRWAYIARVKAAVSIPVFGNGNVFSEADCLRMFRETGCDGVALGRIAVARPWIFAQFSAGLHPGEGTYRGTARRHLDLLGRHFDPAAALGRFKRFSLYFSANFRFGHTLHSRIQSAGSLEEARGALDRFFRDGAERTAAPNLSLFR